MAQGYARRSGGLPRHRGQRSRKGYYLDTLTFRWDITQRSKQMFRLSEQVVAVIVSSGGAVHPYRAVTSIFADLLNQYPDQ
jgi:hypothetical protein